VGLFNRDKEKKNGLSALVDKAKGAGVKIPDYILDLVKIVAPRLSVITDAIKKLKGDREIDPFLRSEILEVLESMAHERENVTERLRIDNASESWLTRNNRPILTMFVALNYFAMKWVGAYNGYLLKAAEPLFYFAPEELDGPEKLLIVMVEFYFGGRAIKLIAGELKGIRKN
jgi:hypothetical protein